MNNQSMIGVSALAVIVVAMVLYRVVWFIRREKRRSPSVVWFEMRQRK